MLVIIVLFPPTAKLPEGHSALTLLLIRYSKTKYNIWLSFWKIHSNHLSMFFSYTANEISITIIPSCNCQFNEVNEGKNCHNLSVVITNYSLLVTATNDEK